MSGKLKGALVGVACLVGCLPLIFTIAGTTSSVAGAVSVRLGRYHLTVIVALGFAFVIPMTVRRTRTAFELKVEQNQQ